MFEGDFVDICADKFPFLGASDPVRRCRLGVMTHMSVSGNFLSPLSFFLGSLLFYQKKVSLGFEIHGLL